MKMPTDKLEAMPDKASLAEVAQVMVLNCFRNISLFENIHASGRISQEEMKALMIEATNRVFTFLSVPGEQLSLAPLREYWNEPVIAENMLRDPEC